MSTPPDGRDDDTHGAAAADGAADAVQTRGRTRLHNAGGAAADGGGNEPSPPRRGGQTLSTQRGGINSEEDAVSDNDLARASPAPRGKLKRRGANTVGRPRAFYVCP